MNGGAKIDDRKIVTVYVAERGNAAAAARELGCDRTVVARCLRSDLGQQILAELTGALLEQYRVSAERLVGEAAAVAFADLPRIMRHALTLSDLNALEQHERAAISELTLADEGQRIEKIKLHPKLPALQLLAQYLGFAGKGDTDTNPLSDRPELGGLTIIGPGGDTDDPSRQSTTIPTPERLG